MLAVTFGLSAVTATLQLIDSVLRGLAGQRVALNPRRSYFDLIDLGLNLAFVAQLVAWGAWRSICCGAADSARPASDWAGSGCGRTCSAASGWPLLIGLPGLALYVAARALGFSAAVVPTDLTTPGGGSRCWCWPPSPTAGPRRSSSSGIC